MEKLSYPYDARFILKKKKSLKKDYLKKEIPYLEKRIALLSGSTLGIMKDCLELFLLDYGIKPIFYEGDYARFYEESVFENKALSEFNPEIIYLHTTSKNIEVYPKPGDSDKDLEEKKEQVYQKFEKIWNHLKENYAAIIIQNNFEPLPYRVLGNADAYHPYGKNNFIHTLNQDFYTYAKQHTGVYINDIAYLSAWYGLEKWANSSQWYLYNYAFDMEAIPLVCQSIARMIKSIYGKNKKALAIDLDNTLWGGVIGDDGIERIKLGEESPEGRAYSEFQAYLKSVSDLGIPLTICSKNDENLAMEAFKHPGSLLKANDFIIKKANWKPKDENITAIAKELNIFSETIILLDDNPVERALITQNLPEVSVVALDAPENYIRCLDQQGYFEMTSVSDDDLKRNKTYQANSKREKFRETTDDYQNFLISLKMKTQITAFRDSLIPRITQLINKTNQFNLTTKRLSEEDVTRLAKDKKTITLIGNLSDQFGESGSVTALIAACTDNKASIDLWVMSCRVFKRDLENAIFDHLIKKCQNLGIKKIIGQYIPTKKNVFVKDLYKNLGFTLMKKTEEAVIWEYLIPENYKNKNTVMEVINDDTRRNDGESTVNF